MKFDCSLDECRTDKPCKCYAYTDELPGQQFCGYEHEGELYPCEMGCCGGCPGSCKDVKYTKPNPKPRKDAGKFKLDINNTFFILFLMVILMTVLIALKELVILVRNGNRN